MPNFAPVFNNRAIAYASKNQPSAPCRLRPGDQAQRGYAVAFYNRGNARYDMGDYEKAVADYSSAIKLNPADTLALNNRGNAYANRRDFDRAIADLTQALKYNPDYAQGYNDRGVAYGAKGDIDRALVDFEQAVKFDPSNSLALLQSRPRASRQERDRPRHREFRPGDQAQSGLCGRALQPRQCLSVQARLRPRHRRLRRRRSS